MRRTAARTLCSSPARKDTGAVRSPEATWLSTRRRSRGSPPRSRIKLAAIQPPAVKASNTATAAAASSHLTSRS